MAATSRSNPVVLIVLVSCLVAVITFGSRSGFGLYLEPITSSRGFGREVFALAIGIQNIVWGVGQPLAGALADRFGTTRVLVGGALLYALGMVATALAATPLALHLSAGLLVGIGGSGASFGIVMAAASRLVPEERRSWAMGLVVASSSLGQFLYAFLNHALITALGWQAALVVLGGILLSVLPMALAFRGEAGTIAGSAHLSLGAALREAIGHRSYLLLVAGFFTCGYHVAFIQTHLPPYIADAGVAPWVAAAAIGLVGLFNMIGSYASGVIAGRRSKKGLLALIYFARSVVILAYVAFPPTATSTLLFSAAMGLLWLSTVPPTSGLVALMFGPRWMATLFGIVFFSHQLGALLGVWLGGFWFDRFGSYDAVWATMVFMGIVAGLLHLPIVEQPVARLRPAPA
ncbi:MAG: MFS transporter [Geminicoccaceae bacterium]|nr:MFS transporter [Geminicoccaceae bacterium]